MLGFCFLAGGNHAGRNMGNTHRTIGRVDVLATGPLRPVCINPQILGINANINFLRLGQNRNRCRRRVNTPAALGHRHTLNAVHATFKLQPGKHIGSRHVDDDFLKPAKVVFAGIHLLKLPAAPFGIPLIHPIQIGRKQGGFFAPGSGADFKDGVLAVRTVFGDQHQLNGVFGLRQLFLNFVLFRLGHFAHIAVAFWIGQNFLGFIQIV